MPANVHQSETECGAKSSKKKSENSDIDLSPNTQSKGLKSVELSINESSYKSSEGDSLEDKGAVRNTKAQKKLKVAVTKQGIRYNKENTEPSIEHQKVDQIRKKCTIKRKAFRTAKKSTENEISEEKRTPGGAESNKENSNQRVASKKKTFEIGNIFFQVAKGTPAWPVKICGQDDKDR